MSHQFLNAWYFATRSLALSLAFATVASAQTQPNPPVGVTIDGSELVFFDDFNYSVGRLDSGTAKTAAFGARGYSLVKDQTMRDGARGYLYTRTSAPGCGESPVGGRMLTLEALPTTLGGQTDFYLQIGNGTAGDIPAKLFVQFYLCMSRSGGEMSDVWSSHNKLFYPLFGSRDSYPMATDDAAWLQTMSDTAFSGSSSIQAPEPGAFTFRNQAPASGSGPRALIAGQEGAGTGWMMTPNVGDPWVRPNRWYKVRAMYDVSGSQGIHRIWMAPVGQSLVLIEDWTGGVTAGFSYTTTYLDRLGAKFLRFPTTVGPANEISPNYWMNLDNLRLARAAADLD